MKLKCAVSFSDIGGELIGVPVGDDAMSVSGVLRVNAQAREIIELFAEDTTEAAVTNALAAKYENDWDTLSAYVHDTVGILREASLLCE